jgi:hypothetical protein
MTRYKLLACAFVVLCGLTVLVLRWVHEVEARVYENRTRVLALEYRMRHLEERVYVPQDASVANLPIGDFPPWYLSDGGRP